ncbi:hypothetical protein DPMN_004134 [Dreissena polymorpha]|uniref:Uncharacterized protein n=1 Tax=Dreissena polymorpha TaxID=45954 RepID=A0A9D4MR31_DREPO|nr:hypothetical protein DPMN_004134 [Dreissena polymorpha]
MAPNVLTEPVRLLENLFGQVEALQKTKQFILVSGIKVKRRSRKRSKCTWA